jgi:hypothetical protein
MGGLRPVSLQLGRHYAAQPSPSVTAGEGCTEGVHLSGRGPGQEEAYRIKPQAILGVRPCKRWQECCAALVPESSEGCALPTWLSKGGGCGVVPGTRSVARPPACQQHYGVLQEQRGSSGERAG